MRDSHYQIISPHTNESISPRQATPAMQAPMPHGADRRGQKNNRMLKKALQPSVSAYSAPSSRFQTARFPEEGFSRKIDLLCGILPDDSSTVWGQGKEEIPSSQSVFFSHACLLLSLGSTSRYSPSAAAFPANTSTALMSVIPIRSGISLPSPAVTAACPSPG